MSEPRIEEHTPSVRVRLEDPSPAASRGAVRRVAAAGALPEAAVEDLVLATSEVVANARRHGRPPVVLEVRAEPARTVVTVREAGDGPPRTPGSPPAWDAEGGRGLWLAHRLVRVEQWRDARGCVVRLTS